MKEINTDKVWGCRIKHSYPNEIEWKKSGTQDTSYLDKEDYYTNLLEKQKQEMELKFNNTLWEIGANIMNKAGVKRIKTSYKQPK